MHEAEVNNKRIWTIGHSTHSFERLTGMLASFNIELVADIRNFPGSRKFPQYNMEALTASLPQYGIQYFHLKNLGGRRKAKPDSENTGWRNAAFRGYADYMDTSYFKEGIVELQSLAEQQRTAYMCSEAVWWRCHRALVSDYLKFNGWNVMHIIGDGKAQEHPYTSPANVNGGKLTYTLPV